MGAQKALRVALVWNGTVMQERLLRLPSEKKRFTIGESRSNDMVISGDQVPRTFELFRQHQGRYALNLAPGMSGKLNLGERVERVEDWAEQTLYIGPGHFGRIEYGAVSILFQFTRDDAVVRRRRFLGGFDGRFATALWFSFFLQFTLVFLAQIFWDEDLSEHDLALDSHTLRILSVAPPDVVQDALDEQDDSADDTTSARAEGPEGRFGPPDAEEQETRTPDHDGPLRRTIDDTDLGRAFDQAIGTSGALTRVFAPNDLANHFGDDFATTGEGDILAVGPGTNGMGLRGLDRGGDGNSFGRVRAVGEIDTGPGDGVSAVITRRPQRPVVDILPPAGRLDNGFLSQEEILRVVRLRRRGIRACYENALLDDRSLQGRIVVNWTIDLDGSVSRRSVEQNDTGSRDLETCLLREIRRMRFPEPDGGMVVVTFPFSFDVRE